MPYAVALGKEAEPLVTDQRLERIFWHLQRLTDFPDGTEFLTVLQEPTAREPRRLAVFLVISEHPRADKRAMTIPKVITMSAIPYDKWKEMNAEYRHYANLTDPIRPIFAGILRRHLRHLKNLKDLD